jgi:hypothetical protein
VVSITECSYIRPSLNDIHSSAVQRNKVTKELNRVGTGIVTPKG